jgi:hypothetical protein
MTEWKKQLLTSPKKTKKSNNSIYECAQSLPGKTVVEHFMVDTSTQKSSSKTPRIAAKMNEAKYIKKNGIKMNRYKKVSRQRYYYFNLKGLRKTIKTMNFKDNSIETDRSEWKTWFNHRKFFNTRLLPRGFPYNSPYLICCRTPYR